LEYNIKLFADYHHQSVKEINLPVITRIVYLYHGNAMELMIVAIIPMNLIVQWQMGKNVMLMK